MIGRIWKLQDASPTLAQHGFALEVTGVLKWVAHNRSLSCFILGKNAGNNIPMIASISAALTPSGITVDGRKRVWTSLAEFEEHFAPQKAWNTLREAIAKQARVPIRLDASHIQDISKELFPTSPESEKGKL